MQHFLALDIGNTRIKLSHTAGVEHRSLIADESELGISSLLKFVSKIELGPADTLTAVYCQTSGDSEGHLEPLFDKLSSLGVFASISVIGWPFGKLHYSNTLGSDRLAAAWGCLRFLQENPSRQCVLVADAGTCLTFELIEKTSNQTIDYYPLSISPGIEMRLASMHEMTGRLPLVTLDDWPDRLKADYLQGDTTSAMLSGAIFGTADEICGQVRRLVAEGHMVDAVLLSGGDALLLSTPVSNSMTYLSTIPLKSRPLPPASEPNLTSNVELDTDVEFVPWLVLDGLLMVAQSIS